MKSAGRFSSALISALVLLGFGFAVPVTTRGAEAERAGNLLEVVAGAARQLFGLVKNQPVSIGDFTATGKRNLNSGPELVALLKEELARLKADVRDEGAPLEIKGHYIFVDSPEPDEAASGQKVVRFDFEVIDTRTGQSTTVPVTRYLKSNTEIARILNITGPLPLDPGKTQAEQRRERNREIQRHLESPPTFIDPDHRSRVSSSPERPYQVEILAGPIGDGTKRPTEARPARLDKGLAFVSVDRGEVYEVRVTNRTAEEVAIRVFIDGLDLFHFSADRNPQDPTRPAFAYLIVPPAQAGRPAVETVAGWHKANAGKPNFLAFLVTAYGAGASARTGVPATGQVGVVQVQFSRCYPAGPGRPRGSANETGFGPGRNIAAEKVVREIEPPIDVVSVRYTR